MAHVGKDFPSLIVHDLSLNGTYRTSPPYRARLTTTSESSGSLTVPWRSQNVMSSEPVVDYTTQTVKYEFQHPTDEHLLIRYTWELLILPYISGSVLNLRIKNNWEFEHLGVVIARQSDIVLSGDLFGNTPFSFNQFTMWAESDDRDLVDEQVNISIHAARWSDVPDYHPRKLH